MDESPVINDQDAEFIPMGAASAAPPPSPVIDDSSEFVPMPTPDRVVQQNQGDRLDAVPFEFADIRALAQRILKRATERGQGIIASAQKQVADMEKAAYDKAYADASEKAHAEGFAKGEAEGMAKAEQKIQIAVESEKESVRESAAPVTAVLQQLGEALNASRQQLIAQAEGDLLLLALDLAKRLVGHELSVDPEAIKPLAIECIGLVTDRTGITARVNPADYEIMEEFYPELKNIYPDLGPVKIIPDPEIERGGLMAATREAEVDMRLATRLAQFEDVILGYSGEDAIAPWSQIPPDAIAAAKAASAESAYSLFGDEQGEQAAPPPEAVQPEMSPQPEVAAAPDEAPAPDPIQDPEAALAQLDAFAEQGQEQEEEPPMHAQPDDVGQMSVPEDVSDLAELADLVDEQPPEQTQ